MIRHRLYNQSGWILPLLIVLTLLMAAASVFLYFQIRNSSKSASVNPAEEKPAQEAKVGEAAGQANSAAEVIIQADGFKPATITISMGQQVTFINRDQNVHRVVPFPETVRNILPQLDSDSLQPSDSFTYTFEKSGIFTLSDYFNLNKFVVTVIVY